MASKAVRRAKKTLRRSREKDFSTTNDVNAAIFANLMKTSKRSARRLTRHNGRMVDKVMAGKESLERSGRKSVRRFRSDAQGGMLGGAEEVMAGQVKTAARAGNVQAKGQAKAAKTIDRSAQGLIDIFKSGAREANASAKALTADALNQRAQADATTVAQMIHDERMVKLQAELQAEQARKEFERQKKLFGLEEKAAQAEIGNGFQAMKPAVTVFSNAVPEILKLSADGMSPTEIIASLVGSSIITQEDAQSPTIMSLVRNLSTNDQPGRDDIVEEFIESMSVSGGWASMNRKQRERMKKYISARLATTVSKYAANSSSTSSGGGSGGDPWVNPGDPKFFN